MKATLVWVPDPEDWHNRGNILRIVDEVLGRWDSTLGSSRGNRENWWIGPQMVEIRGGGADTWLMSRVETFVEGEEGVVDYETGVVEAVYFAGEMEKAEREAWEFLFKQEWRNVS